MNQKGAYYSANEAYGAPTPFSGVASSGFAKGVPIIVKARTRDGVHILGFVVSMGPLVRQGAWVGGLRDPASKRGGVDDRGGLVVYRIAEQSHPFGAFATCVIT